MQIERLVETHAMVMKLFWLSVYYGDETTFPRYGDETIYIEEHTDHVLWNYCRTKMQKLK